MLQDLPSFQALKQRSHSPAPNRNSSLRQISAAGLTLDHTRTAPNDEIWALLFKLIDESKLSEWRDKLFAGEKINASENRAAWHTKLRSAPFASDVKAMHDAMQRIAKDMQSRGITDVVNIGIGGSDLGARLAVDALTQEHQKDAPRIHFLHNIDPSLFARITRNLNPKNTAFIVSSKSFTTEETMLNAAIAKDWCGGKTDNFYAVTNKPDKAKEFGIAADHIAIIEDWVGGRFSVWSAVGLPLMLAIGADKFQEFLAGAAEMDKHFQNASPKENLPILLALLTIYHRNLCHCAAEAIVPYIQDLALLPDYLQQLIMESNGKSEGRSGRKLLEETAPVIFGGAGTNAQHSFFQALHQGTTIVPVQIIACLQGGSPSHDALFANALAQSNALAENARPSSLIVIKELNAKILGSLLALYEHMVFVQGVLWDINSFDQPGVELGKRLAGDIKRALTANTDLTTDPSTASLIQAYKNT